MTEVEELNLKIEYLESKIENLELRLQNAFTFIDLTLKKKDKDDDRCQI